VELIDGSFVIGPPKSPASGRIVSIPPFLLADVESHLDQFTRPADDALVFTGPKGVPLRRSNFTREGDRLSKPGRHDEPENYHHGLTF
jgi:hypothetical protein